MYSIILAFLRMLTTNYMYLLININIVKYYAYRIIIMSYMPEPIDYFIFLDI